MHAVVEHDPIAHRRDEAREPVAAVPHGDRELIARQDGRREPPLDVLEAVGVTAGASAPELLVQQVVDQLREWGGTPAVEVVGREENVVFTLPKELRRSA